MPDYIPDGPPPPIRPVPVFDYIPGVTLLGGTPAPAAPDAGSGQFAVSPEAPTPARAAPVAREAAPQRAGQEAAAAPERERVVVSGRVGKPPVSGTTPKGQPKLTFQVAEHPEPDQTVWHHIVAFAKRAEQLRGTLRGGEPVEVVGYRHERTVTGRDGRVRTVAEIYATAVRSLTPKPAKQ